MKFLILFLLSIFILSCKSQSLSSILKEGSNIIGEVGSKPTQYEIGRGLKEALSVSIEKGARSLSLKDGFLKNEAVKILLPPEIKKIQSTLIKIGLGGLSSELTVKLNRAAEDAAIKSIPIFKKAVLSMSFDDVMNVLTGPNDAATSYLKKETSSEILKAFTPQISSSLNKVGASTLWAQIFNRYNKLPFVKKVNPDLISYTSNRALEGLFFTVSKRESGIRESFNQRTTPLLRKVFGYADSLKN